MGNSTIASPSGRGSAPTTSGRGAELLAIEIPPFYASTVLYSQCSMTWGFVSICMITTFLVIAIFNACMLSPYLIDYNDSAFDLRRGGRVAYNVRGTNKMHPNYLNCCCQETKEFHYAGTGLHANTEL